jgi:two-component system, sensor histidine kinase and response regulator
MQLPPFTELICMGVDSSTVFDPQELMDRCLSDVDFAIEMLTMFQARVPELMGKIVDALSAGSVAEAAGAAHALKGTAGNVAAKQLHAQCATIEKLLRQGQFPEAKALFPQLRDAAKKATDDVPMLVKNLRKAA